MRFDLKRLRSIYYEVSCERWTLCYRKQEVHGVSAAHHRNVVNLLALVPTAR